MEKRGLAMKLTRSAIGAAMFIVFLTQAAAAQGGPPPSDSAQPGPPPPGSAQPGPSPSGAPPPATVFSTVNLRQGPGTTYTVITKIPAGASVEVSGCSGQWCQVAYQGQNGYVIATSLAPGGGPGGPPPGAVAGGPPPGYGPPPPGYYPPDYYPPPYYGPYRYYYGYGPYYGGYYHRRW